VVADTTARPGIGGLFEGLLPVEVIAAYERLLASDGCAADQADALVGEAGLVTELTRRGMAHIQPHTPVDPAWLRPAAPDVALQGVLAGHQTDLARGQELLLDGHRRLADAQARYSTGLTSRLPGHLAGVVSGPGEIGDVSAALMNTARRDWMTLENPVTEMPVTPDFAQPPLPAFAGRVRCRSIYETAMMDDPAARQNIQACVQAGEEARLLLRVPMKMKLADQATALLPLTPVGTSAALVIRAPVILAALREYFELLWARATPLTAPPPKPGAERPTPAQQKVLDLMVLGHGDDAIASRLGISTTTVRRHITALSTRLGVSSRFALGAAAYRHRWIA
jgi:DNA-binding CsgD family transcriptional regulator